MRCEGRRQSQMPQRSSGSNSLVNSSLRLKRSSAGRKRWLRLGRQQTKTSCRHARGYWKTRRVKRSCGCEGAMNTKLYTTIAQLERLQRQRRGDCRACDSRGRNEDGQCRRADGLEEHGLLTA